MKILDIIQKLERETKIEKTKRAIKRSIMGSFPQFFLIISLITNNNGIKTFRVDPTGFVHKSYNNIPSDGAQVTLVRKPLQGVDTVITDVWADQWATLGSNFIPELTNQDTLWSFVKKDTLGRTFYCTTWLTGGARNPLETCLLDPAKPGFFQTVQIKNVKDTSNVNSSLIGIFILDKNPLQPCTTLVDTAGSPFHIVDWYLNTQYQDSSLSQGDSVTVEFKKTRNDTTYFSEFRSAIDTLYIHAMCFHQGNVIPPNVFHGDTLYFPQSFTVFKDIGIEQILVPDSADSGTVIVPGVVVKNYGTINQDPWLHCKINEFYHDSMNVVAQPGIDTFYFSPCTLNSIGEWLVTSYSILPGDVNPSNDTLRKTIVVNPVGIEENKERNLEEKVEMKPTIIKKGQDVSFNGNYDELRIYDVSGREVASYSKDITRYGLVPDFKNLFSNLPQGVYFWDAIVDDKRGNGKVVVVE